MKNRAGKIIGFVVGMGGFLFLFKLIILDHTSPSDELAPGVVLTLSLLSGLLFAFAGNVLQKNIKKKGHKTA